MEENPFDLGDVELHEEMKGEGIGQMRKMEPEKGRG